MISMHYRSGIDDDVMLAFPAGLGALLPPPEVIPLEYPYRQEWLEFQNKWFAGALPSDLEMWPSDGVDAKVAWRHLAVHPLQIFDVRESRPNGTRAWDALITRISQHGTRPIRIGMDGIFRPICNTTLFRRYSRD